MKRLKLVISDVAVADLVDLWTFIAENSPQRADPFVDQIREKCATLAEVTVHGGMIHPPAPTASTIGRGFSGPHPQVRRATSSAPCERLVALACRGSRLRL